MFKIIIMKDTVSSKKLEAYIDRLKDQEKALRKRNQRIAHLSKKVCMLQEKVTELEVALQIRSAQLPDAPAQR